MTKELKGWHVLAIAVGAFGVIIGVNLVLAFKAVETFPGLEVKNSYVASQSFDRERAAQEALGWVVTPDFDGEYLTIKIADKNGMPVEVQDFTATIGRPTHVRDDQSPVFVREAGVYRAPVTLAPGAWIIHVQAHAADGTEFKQRIDHFHGARVGASNG